MMSHAPIHMPDSPPFALSQFTDAAVASVLEEVLTAHTLADLRPPEDIGGCRAVEKLGEGGFGVVWRGEQTEPVRREVAIKLIKPGVDSEEVLARFQREQQVLARLSHPGIARVFEAGLSQDDRPFIIMELVKGSPITTFCRDHVPDLGGRVALLRRVCSALQHAHEKGVIHRDLKPSNILITDMDGAPGPKIIDFGIAKALSREGQPGLTWMTRQSQLVGTPSYMSPEQTLPGSRTDVRTDVYALGALLYEVVAGRPPFQPGGSLFQQLRQVREVEPSRLPREAGDLNWIALRCLEKDPARRYPSVAALDEDLRCWMQGSAVSAHPPTVAYRLGRWLRRNRVLASSAAVVALSIVAGSSVALWKAREAKQRQREAEAAETALINSMHRAITTKLGHAPRAYDLAKDVLLQIKANEFHGPPELLREILAEGAAAAKAAGDDELAAWALGKAQDQQPVNGPGTP